MGGGEEDYRRMAPKWSYVYALDFESPERLAEYLWQLDGDDELYNEYFKWRGSGELIDTKFFCRLCAMLHDDGAPVKHYRDFGAWWNGPGVCQRPVAPLLPPPTVDEKIDADEVENELLEDEDEFKSETYEEYQ